MKSKQIVIDRRLAIAMSEIDHTEAVVDLGSMYSNYDIGDTVMYRRVPHVITHLFIEKSLETEDEARCRLGAEYDHE